jgi:glycosyltransferase involved in cell wall biosynthesis
MTAATDQREHRRLRVLIAHSFYRLPGGEDRYVSQQVPLLARRHDVELLSRHNTDLGGGIATAARMTMSRREQRRVEVALDRFSPDVVHLHNAYPSLGPAVHLAAHRRRVPLVMTVHNFRLRCPNGYMFTEGAPCRRCEGGMYAHAVLHRCFPSRSQSATYASALWLHRFVLRLQDKVDLFVTPSEFVGRRVVEWGIPEARVMVVRNFTAFALGRAAPGDYGLYLGRLSGEKGVDVLLRALREAGDPPFRVVGDGPLKEPLARLARDLGLRRVQFTGQVPGDDVPGLLRSARLLALPSVWDENAPIAALEAMTAGRPLVVTRTGGLPELVRGGEGLQCEPGDVQGLAACIRSLFEDDRLCLQAGERALARAASELSPEQHLDRLEGAYERALAL